MFISSVWFNITSTANEISIEKSLNLEGVTYTCEMNNANSMCGSISASTKVNQVKINPGFTSVTLDAGKIQFTDLSTASGDSITNYYWDFGDGKAGSLDRNPIHQYTEYKNFEVKLKVTTQKGCNVTFTELVTPTRHLTADLVPTDTTLYNGRTKDYKAVNLSITGLSQGRDYYLVYINQEDTTKKSFDAPSTVGDYIVRFELSPLVAYKYIMDTIPFKKFSITPAPLTITPNDYSKTYGQGITLQGSAFTASMNPLYAGDKIYELKLSCKGLSDTASVSSIPYEITIDSIIGTGLRNYTITPLKGKLTVAPKDLAIHAIDNSKTYGDTVIVSGKEFYIDPRDLVRGDTVKSVSLKCDGFSRTAAAGGDSIRITGITFARQANYSITYKPAYLTIDKKRITVTAHKCSKVYGTSYTFSKKDYTFDATQLIGDDRIDAVPMASDATPFNAPVRNDYRITLGKPVGNRLENYTINLSSDSTFEVTRKPITITAKDTTKVYGDIMEFKGTEFSTDVPLVAGDIISSVSLQSDGSGKNYSVGSYEIIPSSATGKGTFNYDFNNYKSGTLKVLAKEIKPQLIAPKDSVYNASRKDISVTITGVDELVKDRDYFIRYTNRNGTDPYDTIIAPIEVGDYRATFELSTTSKIASNYLLANTPSVNFSIKPAVLTIAAAPASKDYGSKEVRFSWSSSGLYSRDQIGSVVLHSVGERDSASVGEYAIDSTQVTGVGLKNYTINFQKGELTVQPRKLTIKAKELYKTYGDIYIPKKTDFSIVNGELFQTDRIDSVAISCNGFGQTAKVGTDTIKITGVHGIRLSNYNISTKAGILTINKKDLTITPLGQRKVYGNVFSFTGNEYDKKQAQLVNKDTIEYVGMASLATQEKTAVGDYTISTCVDSVKGIGLENYKIIIDTLKNKFTIDPRPITIRVDTLTKIYGDELVLNGTEFKTESILAKGDVISSINLSSEGCSSYAQVREYDITVSGVNCDAHKNYIFRPVPGKLNVVKRKLAATLDVPKDLSYNAQPKKLTATTNIAGLNEGIDYKILYASLQDTTEWTNTAPSVAGKFIGKFVLYGNSPAKYYMDSIPRRFFTIERVPLTITPNKANKTYGENLTLPGIAFKSSMSRLYGYDRIDSVVLSCDGLKDTASVKPYYIIKVDSIKGSGLENYQITTGEDTLTVNQRNLEIQAIGKTKTYGDSIRVSGKEFTIKPGSMVGNDYVETVSISCDGFKTTAECGTDTIEITNAAGKGLSNYNINYKNAILAINPKELTITPRKQTKVYGDAFSFTGKEYTVSQGNLIGNDLIETVEMISPATEVNTSAGTHKISIGKIKGTGLNNYIIRTGDSTFTVTPKPITIWIDTLTKKYGEQLSLDGKKFRASATAPCDKIEELRLESDGVYADAAVNEKGYGIKATEIYGILKQNYNITVVDGLLKVTRLKLTAGLVAPSYLGYDAKGKKFSATVDIPGLKEGTDYEIRYLNLADTTQLYSNITPTAAGNYRAIFVLTSLATNKYFMESVPSMEFSIKKAPLSIKAKDASKTYGNRLNPADIGFVVTNGTTFFGNDMVTKLDFESKGLADTASVGKPSVIPVKAYGYGLENYDIRFENGILSVNPKELVLKALDDTKTYGDNISPVGNKFYVDPSSLVGNDCVTSVTLASEGYAPLAQVGNYALKASDAKGNRLNNYTISYEDGNLRVNKKKITVSAKALSKTYGSEYVFRGDEFVIPQNELVGNDRINSVKLGSLGATKKASVGEYTLAITDVSGYRTENYDIATEGNLFKVTPMPIVVKARNLEKEYGDVLSFNGNEFSTDLEPVNGDTISFVFMRSNGSAESASIGEYDIIPSQAFGAGSLNYNISYRNGKLNVIQKELKVTAQNCEKEYGEKDPELRFSAVDRRGIEYQSSIFTGKMTRQAGEKAGTYTINVGSLSIAPSYKFNFTEGQLTIQKALPVIDPSFTNEGGQFVAAAIIGAKNGSTPQGNLKVKITQAGIEKTTEVVNGESKCAVSGLPAQMTVTELEYLGDENYLPTTQTLNIYAIVYHANGGNMVSPVTNFDGSESVKLENPTREQNYKFEGWYETEDFSGEPIRRIPLGTAHDVHLYAKWSTTYEDLSLVVLFNQVLAVANPLNRDFLYKSTYKWYKDGVQLNGSKQYFGFEDYVPSGLYRVEIYYQNDAPIVLELNHTAIIPKSKVYPNPVSKNAELKLSTELVKENEVTVEVLNSAGLRQQTISVKRYDDLFKLNGFKDNGLYIIQVKQKGEIKETHKVIVEN